MYHWIEIATCGFIAAWTGWELVRPVSALRNHVPREQSRRIACRKYWRYWLLESSIDRLVGSVEFLMYRLLRIIDSGLPGSSRASFTPSELIAERLLFAFATALLLMTPAHAMGTGIAPLGILFGITMAGCSAFGIGLDIARSNHRRDAIQKKLPFSVELMAVLLESGGTTPMQALQHVQREYCGHPLGQDLDSVMSHSRNFSDAMQAWGELARNDNIRELTFALKTADQTGSPLAETLRAMATQLLQRRAHDLEKAAERAKVHIVWPGMLIMLACLLVVTTPFVLSVLDALE